MPLKFVLDSGASDVCIPADVAQTLFRMGRLTSADNRGIGSAELANGAHVTAQRVNIRSIQVGGYEVKNVPAFVTNAQGSLLLGQSFLRRFKSWTVENHGRSLRLHA
jgi:clan AA aspartic protease (TIGR02281 family)